MVQKDGPEFMMCTKKYVKIGSCSNLYFLRGGKKNNICNMQAFVEKKKTI